MGTTPAEYELPVECHSASLVEPFGVYSGTSATFNLHTVSATPCTLDNVLVLAVGQPTTSTQGLFAVSSTYPQIQIL